jgi:diadenosine tetraphosphate (Ap4A) HIT family hydrolase
VSTILMFFSTMNSRFCKGRLSKKIVVEYFLWQIEVWSVKYNEWQVRRLLIAATLLATLVLRADFVTCNCDPTKPETLEARQCSLCREAEKQPTDAHVFFLQDANPSKPNRWLALPRTHERAIDLLSGKQRTELLSDAITKAKSLFGDQWAIAYNAPNVQTQCHVHLHIGKLIPGVETSKFVTVPKIADIPVPEHGEGYWVHPQGNQFHVHTGEQVTETVLER